MDDGDVRGPHPPDALLQLSCPRLVCLDRDDLAVEHRRLAAGRRAEIEHALSRDGADREPGQLRAGALRPDPALGERLLVDALDAPGTGDVGIGLALDLAADEPDDERRRLVLGLHQRAGAVGAESRHHVSATQSG